MRASFAIAAAAAMLAAGCSALPPAPTGQPLADVLKTLGPPTARHALPEGVERLEYATGPYGRATWMVDLDGTGRVLRSMQVLNEANFAGFAERVAGMPREAVLRELGTPGERSRVRHPAGETWSWRYPTNDCLWFQVSMGDDGKAVSAGYNIDPRCDAPSDARN
jgi:hypothetical protein